MRPLGARQAWGYSVADVPLLRLWRTLGPREIESLPDAAQDLVVFLSSRLIPANDKQRAIFDRLLRGDHLQPGLQLAAELDGFPRSFDLMLTATLVSALAGSRAAALALGQSLLDRASNFRRRAARRHAKGARAS